MIYASQDVRAATSTRCQRQHRSIKTTECRVPAVVASREEQSKNSEIKEDRINDKETRLGIASKAAQTNLREASISISIRSAASGASPESNSVNLMLVRLSRQDGKRKEKNEAHFQLPSWSS